MPIPQTLVTQYFQVLAKREFSEAEHNLELIKLNVHFIIPDNEFENLLQLLDKRQIAEVEVEIDRLKEVLMNKQLPILQREFDRFRRTLGPRQSNKIKQMLEVITNMLINKQFAELKFEIEKLEQLADESYPSEALSALGRFKRIALHKQFTENASDLDTLKQLVDNKQFDKAKSEVQKFKLKRRKTDWDKGYFRALYGMYLSRKNVNDGYSFFSKLDISDKVALNAYKKEFLNHVSNGLHGDFDRGYFSAWSDCMRILTRMEIPSPQNGNDKVAGEEKIETLRSDKSQATIANFIEKSEDE